MPYTPAFLRRMYARKWLKNRKRYADIDRAIKASRLNFTVYEFLAAAAFYSCLVFVLSFVFLSLAVKVFFDDVARYAVSITMNELVRFLMPTVKNVPHFGIGDTVSEYSPIVRYYAEKYYYIAMLIPSYLFYRLARYSILSYPFFLAKRRKGEIDLYLPHAVNMMYGMAVGGLSPVEVLKEVSKLHYLFGEVSVELKEVIKHFEVFRKDIFSSMRYVRDTTPSKKLSAFLDSLIVVLQGGGSLVDYLKSKSEEYEEEKDIAFDEVTSFMEILFEIYISIFMMFPLLLLIVLVVSKFISQDIMDGYVYMIYFLLPVSAVFIIYLAKSTLPFTGSSIVAVKDEGLAVNVYVYSRKVRRFKRSLVKRIVNRIVRFALHPYTTPIAYMDSKIVAVHVLIYSAAAFYILWSRNYIEPENYAIPAFALFSILTVIFEMKHRVISRAEERLPEFFSEIAMLNESGVSIFDGIRLVSRGGTDILSREFADIGRYVEIGLPVTRSFSRLAYRIKSDIFAKAIPIAVKTLETNSTVKDAFTTVSRFIESEILFRKRLKSSLMPYLAIVYLSVGVFIFVTYLLISKFLVVFSGMDVEVMGMKASFDVEMIRQTFMRTLYLISFLSGIIAGTISEMRVTGGFKHALFLTFITYVSFTYFV
ncbi:type II secretion system F family protein [Geoglobus acetivorans]|uniref:Type II secretion system protein n=1 Tax=Geoglobus acetivorans TaxID=565033 RepID=A0A0A7GBB1_GEOAI|nr:type II secretion system protein [Geoglobus acetivorans]